MKDNPTNPTADAIEQRVVAFAEQLGRLVGTVQARADGWLDRQALNEQLTRIRDGAASLLSTLGGAASESARAARTAAREAKAAARPKVRKARKAASARKATPAASRAKAKATRR